MAQQMLPRDERKKQDPAIDSIQSSLRRLQEMITPENLQNSRRYDQIIRLLEDIGRSLAEYATRAAVPSRTTAPRRTYAYDVTIGGTQYRLTLPNALPRGREAQELIRMARGGQLFERLPRPSTEEEARRRVQTPDSPRPLAEVRIEGGPNSTEFNGRSLSARVDIFQANVVNAAESGTSVTVAAAR